MYVNKKARLVVNLLPVSNDMINSDSAWWLDTVLDVYSKRSNIRQLRREKLIRSPSMLNTYIDVADGSPWCPWIPGLSFQTDGFQIKLPLCTLAKRQTLGLSQLKEKGFSGYAPLKKNKDVEIDISTMKKGIFCQPKQKLVLDPEKAKDYMFVGFDPGRARPCSLCALDGSQMPQDWNSSERVEVLDKSLQSNEFITNDEYNRSKASEGTTQQRKIEQLRRQRPAYKNALALFKNTHCKKRTWFFF